MTATDQKKFAGDVREAVKEALAEKEEAQRLLKVEELLVAAETAVKDLTDSVTSKEEELASATEQCEALKTQVEELQTKATELEEKLNQAGEESKGIEERAVAAGRTACDPARSGHSVVLLVVAGVAGVAQPPVDQQRAARSLDLDHAVSDVHVNPLGDGYGFPSNA